MRAGVLSGAGTALIATALCAAGAVAAEDEPPARIPAEGLAILDCAPPAPAPKDSCLLRVPPLHQRGRLTSQPSVDGTAAFGFVRPGDPAFPDGLELSETLVLVDLTPGPGGGRRATFAEEKALLLRVAEGLPDGEVVAVYGFNEGIEKLSDFTADGARTIAAMEAVELRGANTRITTFVLDAIRVLAEREGALLKNVIVISDGDEEGIEAIPELRKAAVEAGVSISALGLFWLPVGSERSGAGMDYLRRITEGSLGATVQVLVRRPEDAVAAVDRFLEGVATARRNSGLIVSKGPAHAAEISVTIREPEIGSSASYVDRALTVAFRPTPEGEAPPAEPPAPPPRPLPAPPPEPRILGLAPPVAFGVGGVGLLAILAGVFFALRRSRTPDETAAPAPGPASSDTEAPVAVSREITENPVTNGTTVPPTAVAPPTAPAHLVSDETGERLSVTGKRTAIGRAAENAIVFTDDSISRVHAELHRNRDGGYSVTDMESLNGTFVNDRRVAGTHAVRDGDRIRFGNIEVRFALEPPDIPPH